MLFSLTGSARLKGFKSRTLIPRANGCTLVRVLFRPSVLSFCSSLWCVDVAHTDFQFANLLHYPAVAAWSFLDGALGSYVGPYTHVLEEVDAPYGEFF